MKKKLLIVGILILVAGGIFFFTRNSSEEIHYSAMVVERGDIRQLVSSTGTISPQNRLEIKPPVAGRVDKILIQEGQVVKRGDVIAWISSNERAALMDAVRTQGPQEIKRWEELYKPTPVIAPIDGTVILKSVEAGQSFMNTDAIFVMADRLTVKAQVDETDIALVQLNQSAEIILDAYPDQTIKGEVVKLAYDSTLTNNVTTYQVDILPVEAPDFLRSGMTCTVNVEVQKKNNVLKVPTAAITTEANGETLLVKKGKARLPISIETGLEHDGFTEVLSGISEGDTIYIREMSLKGKSSTGSNPFMPGGRRGRR